MKKLFFIAALAGAALVSCTKNEVAPSVQQDEITFLAPVVGAQTKVNGLIGSTYNTGESFDVWCVHNAGDITEWGGAVYFSNVKATYDGTSTGWILSPKYYWPATGKLSFVAMSPSIDKATSYDNTNGFQITDAWMQGNDETKIVDLMYSDESLNNAKADYNLDGEEKTGDANTYKGVDIKFNHALSYLTFKVKSAADYTTTTKFKLNKITLSGVYTAGTFNQKAADPWTEDTSGEKGTYIAYNNASGLEFDYSLAVDAPAQEGKEIILLPQALTASQQKITVNYQISTDNGTSWINQEQVADIKGAITSWEMGKKYIYTITIGMNEIIFDPAVADWTAEVPGGVSF